MKISLEVESDNPFANAHPKKEEKWWEEKDRKKSEENFSNFFERMGIILLKKEEEEEEENPFLKGLSEYRELQKKLKSFREKGLTTIKLNQKKAVLAAELERIESS